MKVVIFTSNSIRHKFFANKLSKYETLIVSECKKSIYEGIIGEHFILRDETEQEYFKDRVFNAPTVPLVYGEVNKSYSIIKDFNPDIGLVFGSGIIREPLISLIPKFINLHLGLSPYYRGSGTNFFPFINEELEYIGATLHHIDSGIDTGDIIAHFRPKIELGDNVHTLGCKTIKNAVEVLEGLFDKPLNRVKQWKVKEKYYKNSDFNETILKEYLKKLNDGLIEKHLNKSQTKLHIINI